VSDKQGKIQTASGGTLFLDEIGDLPLAFQVKLLRALDEKTVTRLGSNKSETADIRILVASNKNLEAEMASGRFREDLYYRIAVVVLNLPPLRERKGDIRVLANKFLADFCKQHSKHIRGFEPDALEFLERCNWPGNVRQLKNQIERLVIICKDVQTVPAEMLSENTRAYTGSSGDRSARREDSPPPVRKKKLNKFLKEVSDRVEREYLIECLREAKGTIVEVAKIAGVERQSIYRLMKKHGLVREDYEK